MDADAQHGGGGGNSASAPAPAPAPSRRPPTLESDALPALEARDEALAALDAAIKEIGGTAAHNARVALDALRRADERWLQACLNHAFSTLRESAVSISATPPSQP